MTTSVSAGVSVIAAEAADDAIISFQMEEHLFLIRKDRGILNEPEFSACTRNCCSYRGTGFCRGEKIELIFVTTDCVRYPPLGQQERDRRKDFALPNGAMFTAGRMRGE